jgi:hypothetical protein
MIYNSAQNSRLLYLVICSFAPNKPRSHHQRKIGDERKLLNMNLKPDKESKKRYDFVFLSEIITNSMYWQKIHSPGTPSNLDFFLDEDIPQISIASGML